MSQETESKGLSSLFSQVWDAVPRTLAQSFPSQAAPEWQPGGLHFEGHHQGHNRQVGRHASLGKNYGENV